MRPAYVAASANSVGCYQIDGVHPGGLSSHGGRGGAARRGGTVPGRGDRARDGRPGRRRGAAAGTAAGALATPPTTGQACSKYSDSSGVGSCPWNLSSELESGIDRVKLFRLTLRFFHDVSTVS